MIAGIQQPRLCSVMEFLRLSWLGSPADSRMLGHSLAILMTTYAHYIPGTQDEAARVMDEILTPIPIELKSLKLNDN